MRVSLAALVFACLLAMLSLPAPAAAESIEDCDGPTPVMTDCIYQKYQAADAELNEVWAEVLATIKPADYLPADAARQWHDSLVAAQRAWITFKEEDCQATAFEWYGGTGANAAVGTCLYQKTVDRTDDLRERYLSR